jgi:Bax protein
VKQIIIILFSFVYLNATGMPDSYYKIRDVKKLKKTFFKTLMPMIKKENRSILKDRKFVKSYFNSGLFGFRHDGIGVIKLMNIKKYYKIKNLYAYEEYLLKVDIIPTSIILAQAALESGWGKSRFVRKANNIFGQWTYSRKGLIPKNRDRGKKHRIKIFNTLQDAIKAYLRNVNTHYAYKSLRLERKRLRDKKQNITGLDLYQEYINYSEIRGEYIKRLKSMIFQNNLLKYD